MNSLWYSIGSESIVILNDAMVSQNHITKCHVSTVLAKHLILYFNVFWLRYVKEFGLTKTVASTKNFANFPDKLWDSRLRFPVRIKSSATATMTSWVRFLCRAKCYWVFLLRISQQQPVCETTMYNIVRKAANRTDILGR